MTDTSRRDQCDPPSATETFRLSLIGRKMCVVLEKFGRASLRVNGFGVCINMNAIEGRSRTMCEDGYFLSSSRSRYLGRLVRGHAVWWGWMQILFPKCDCLCRNLISIQSTGRLWGQTLSVSQSFFKVSTSSFITVPPSVRGSSAVALQSRLTPYVVVYSTISWSISRWKQELTRKICIVRTQLFTNESN